MSQTPIVGQNYLKMIQLCLTKNKPNKTEPTKKYNVKYFEAIERQRSELPQESCSFVFLGATTFIKQENKFHWKKMILSPVL